MITAPAYQGKKVGVFGLARTGVAAVEALTASGATVYAWDDSAERREVVKSAAKDLYKTDFAELDALLLAPGVPLTHPKPHELVTKAMASNTVLISDIDVFEAARPTLPEHMTVGITGTNGKSTTTALIGHIINVCGRPVAVGGNIGTGVLALSALPKGGVYIFELSSFQLDLTQHFKADVAVLLNVSPDHLDRHGTFENYYAAKKRLFDLQRGTPAVAVIGVDDVSGQRLATDFKENVVPISVERILEQGVFVDGGQLFDALDGHATAVGDLNTAICLRGNHNWQNAAAAYAVAISLGLNSQDVFEAILSFPGLVHRQELVAEVGNVRFVNDSKATNSDAAIRALQSFEAIHWIAGGRAKETSFAHMQVAASSVKKAYFIGEAAAQLRHDLIEIPHQVFNSLRDAFHSAVENAKAGETILLSPACTAFDQFSDFEKRGDAFRDLVMIHKGANS